TLPARPRPARRSRPGPAQPPPGIPRALSPVSAPPVPGVEAGGIERRGEPGIQPLPRLPARLSAPRAARLGGHCVSTAGRRRGGPFVRPDLAHVPARARTAGGG